MDFLDLGACFLSQIKDVFSYYIFRYVLCPFLPFWDPYNSWCCFRGLLISSHFFSFFSIQLQWLSTPLSCSSLISFSVSFGIFLILFSGFFIVALYSSFLFGCSLQFLILVTNFTSFVHPFFSLILLTFYGSLSWTLSWVGCLSPIYLFWGEF